MFTSIFLLFILSKKKKKQLKSSSQTHISIIFHVDSIILQIKNTIGLFCKSRLGKYRNAASYSTAKQTFG